MASGLGRQHYTMEGCWCVCCVSAWAQCVQDTECCVPACVLSLVAALMVWLGCLSVLAPGDSGPNGAGL